MVNSNTLTLAYGPEVVEEKEKLFNLYSILYILVGFLLGHAVLGPSLYTFSIIYLTVFIKNKDKKLWLLIFFTVGVSLLISGGFSALIYLSASFSAFLVRNIIVAINRKKENYITAITTALTHLILYFSYYYFITEKTLFDYFVRGSESAIIFFIILFIDQYQKQIDQKKLNDISFIILLSGSFIGLASLLSIYTVYSFYIMDVSIIICITIISWYTGMEKGVFYAVLLGTSLFLTGFIPFLSLVKYLVYSLVVGIFSGEKKYLFLPALLFSFLLYSGLSPTYEDFLLTLGGTAVSGILFFLLPEIVCKKFFGSGIKEKYINSNKIINLAENNKYIDNSFQEMAQVFSELSVTFSEVLPLERKEFIKRNKDFLYLYKSKVCNGCQHKRSCWENKKKRDKKILNILRHIDQNGFSRQKLINEVMGCPVEKLKNIKNCYEILVVNSFWRKKIIEKQEVVSKQLNGISQIIEVISSSSKESLNNRLITDDISTNILKNEFDIFEFDIQKEIKTDILNLSLKMDPCSGNKPCQNQLKDLLDNEFSTHFRLISKECGNKLQDKPCHVKYGEVGKYRLEIAVKQIAKEDSSGDSYVYHPLADGTDILALSDGMGVGKNAAIESRSALRLLERLIKAGFSRKLAIETINSALFLRNQNEKFTTLDIVFFDTFTGNIVFNKIGSMPSYIKRNWDVETINPSSLPVGILENIEITEKKTNLKDGDFVVMFSDGVVDAVNHIIDKEKWFIKIMQNSSFDRSRDLVDYIFDVVQKRGDINDDLTIVVFKICEIDKKSRK